jgi:F-type H+-transporting ATPase subunit b
VEVDFAQMIFAISNFIILMIAMYFLMYKPLKQTMDKRQDKIKGDIETAEQLKADADQMKVEITAELAKSRETAQEIIARAEKTAEVQKDEIVLAAKAEAQKMIDKAHAEIKEEKEKVLGEIRDEAATLAMMAATKLIERSLDDADHKQLVDKYIEEAGEVQ